MAKKSTILKSISESNKKYNHKSTLTTGAAYLNQGSTKTVVSKIGDNVKVRHLADEIINESTKFIEDIDGHLYGYKTENGKMKVTIFS